MAATTDTAIAGQRDELVDKIDAEVDRLVEKHGRRNLHIKVKRIVGWASAIGDAQSNQLLSEQRAQAVHQYLLGKVNEAGYSLIPVRVYFKNGKAKLLLALAKGKRKHDKRETIRRREEKRDLQRAMRKYK